jgi:methionyl-tRNA formyltransferase
MIVRIKGMNPDLIVVAAYGKLIPKIILDAPKYKSLNIHPSMLPEFRGPSPIQNAILSGKKETGITIMLLDEKMDHGDILAQTKVKIYPEENTEDLTKKIIPLCINLLLETIPVWIQGKIKPQKQDDSKATYCQLIEREDGHIFWNEEAAEIYNKFKALTPWPGIFTVWEKDNAIIRLKLVGIKISEKDQGGKYEIGEIFRLSPKEIGVKTAKGVVILEEIQMEGKNPIKTDEFLNGYPDFVGSKLK